MTADQTLIFDALSVGDGAKVHRIKEAVAIYKIMVRLANKKPSQKTVHDAEEAEARLRALVPAKKYFTACASAY